MTPIATIASYEIAGRMIMPRGRETGRDRVERMQRAFEAAGVEFHENGDGAGVRLRKASWQ